MIQQPAITLNDGNIIPQIGIGVYQVRGDDLTQQVCEQALSMGYRHIDTAHAYQNERGVGRAVAASGLGREDIWVTSKLWPSEYGEGVTANAIDRMLDRLGTDHIDLLLLHQQFGDYLGAWKAMERAVDAGKVRSVGLSNFESDRLEQVIDAARILPSVLQVECHPYYQQNKLKTRLAPYGIALEAWYPLGHGDTGLLSDPVILRLAERYGRTPAQIILRWHVQEGTIVFPRSTNPEHMRQNIDILDFSLSEQDMEAIRLLDKGQRFFTMTLEEQEAHLSQFKPAD
nr:aldo/keto reductase [Bifidobacterium catenulatum]